MDFNRIFEEKTTNESLEYNSKISVLEEKPYSNTININSNINNIDYIKNNKYEKINFSGLSICDGNILNDRNIKHNNIFTNMNNHSNNLKVKEITLTQLNQLLSDSISNSINDILIFDCRTLKEYKENKNIINDILNNNKYNNIINNSNVLNNNKYSNIINNSNLIWFKNIHDNITLLKNANQNHIIFYTNDNKRSLEIKEIIINLQKGFIHDTVKKYSLLEIIY